MLRLLASPRLAAACPEPFNEGLLLGGREPAERQQLQQQLQARSPPTHTVHLPVVLLPCPCIYSWRSPYGGCCFCIRRSHPCPWPFPQVAFHNITKLLDCVGCEKCKLHGKLQILGLATSLKILFSLQQQEAGGKLRLHRNEIIALVNMLYKVAESVETVRQLSLQVAAS